MLQQVVEYNDKKRFAFNEDGTKIRASQGHSLEVELDYQPQKPPAVLFHGTTERFLDAILEQGLQKRRRHHVHLSPDVETAANVGRRHGKPVVLAVQAARMHAEGHLFFCSANGVWLTEAVPPKYLSTDNQP
jgi:putative RNA 2'-phosphotransferase